MRVRFPLTFLLLIGLVGCTISPAGIHIHWPINPVKPVVPIVDPVKPVNPDVPIIAH